MSSANSICTALLRMDTPPFSHVQTHPSTVLPYLKKKQSEVIQFTLLCLLIVKIN